MSAAPIDLAVSIAPESINLAEVVTLEVRASLGLDWTLVENPLAELEAGSELGGFIVERVAPARPTIEEGRLIRTWSIELAPAMTGRAEVPPLAFRAEQPGASVGPTMVETPALGVDVVSLLESAGEEFQPAMLLAPVQPPTPTPEGGIGSLVLGGVIGAALAVLVVWVIVGRTRHAAPSPIAGLRQRLSQLDESADDRQRALAAAAIAREALGLGLGPRALAATPGEIRALLSTDNRQPSPDELAALELIERAEHAAYAPHGVPMPDLDPRPVVEPIARAFVAQGTPS